MSRLAQLIRTGALISLLAVASHGSMATAEAMKGFRALIFSGEMLREPIRIGDFDTATELYLRFMRGTALSGDSVGVVEGRRCVCVSAFLANEANMNTPVEALPAGFGNYNYRLYLFENGARPVVMAGPRLWRLTTEVAQQLATSGVPIADSTRATRDCLSR